MKTIDRQILRLALPSIVSNITVPLLGLCDVTVMGHVGGAEGIGAIAVGSMIFNVMYWLFVFLRMSASGLTAQAYGAHRWADTRRLLRRSLTTALLFGIAIVVLQMPLRRLTFWLMQVQPQAEQLCTTYYYICIWGAPAVLGLYALTGWFVGMQNTRVPMLIAIGQNIVNIGLSLTLVLVYGMGLKGVAIGTLVAQWAGFAFALWKVKGEGLKVEGRGWREDSTSAPGKDSVIPPSTLHPSPSTLHRTLFLRTLCLVSVNLYFTSAGSAQGPLILAANALLMQFFTVYSYMMDGFANAGEALAGRYYGAGDGPMLSLTVRRLFLWGGAVTLLFTAVYWLLGPWLLTLFTDDTAVVVQATVFLPWAVLIPLAGMAAFVWDGIFIGTTRSRGMLAACFWAAVVFFVLWFALSPLWGNHALWVALLSYLSARGLVQTWLWRKSRPTA